MLTVNGRRAGLLAALVGVLSAGQPAPAAESTLGQSTSLRFIPADAAFYSTALRNREQWQTILRSNAFARLKALPLVQQGWAQVKAQFSEEGKLAQLYKFYQQPENQELVALLGDMVSDEVFVYGSENWAPFLELAQNVYWDMQVGRWFKAFRLTGQAPSPNPLKAILESLAEHEKLIKIPDVILGFKVRKTERAEAQLKRLEKLLKGAFRNHPQLQGRLKREKIGGGDFLTLRFDGRMVPWDELPIKNLEDKEGEFDSLIKKLKSLHFTIGAGVRDGYLVVLLGESTAPLTRLGQGALLVDRPELRPLQKFADKRLTAINYVSRKMNLQVHGGEEQIGNLVAMCKQFLPEGVSAEKRARIEKDLEDAFKHLKVWLPKPGATSSFTYLNGHGFESYAYDWTKYPQRDGSKPLTLLNHAGGDPLLVVAGRSKTSPEQYRMAAKLLRLAKEYADVWVQAKADEEDREKYQKVFQALGPLFKRLGEVTEKMLMPALAEGQAAFVLDAKLKSKQWINKLPETDQALPLPEPAILVSVSDADKLREAFSQYRSIANQMLAKLHEVNPDKIPELKIPRAKTTKGKAGTYYAYPLPESWGLDARLAPTAGLSDKVMAMTISRDHARRLLAETPLKVRGGPLENADRPLAVATYFSMPRTVDALRPWLELAVQKITPRVMRVDEDDPNDKARADQMVTTIGQHVRTVCDVLKVFRNYSSVTYLENDVWVTHATTVIRDVAKE